MPPFHIATTFLGQPCGSGSTHGVNPEMHERLMAAEREIQASFDAFAPGERTSAFTGAPGASLWEWAGVHGLQVCWRPNAAQHSAGAAIDLNSADNPYIVTRCNGVPGGEAGGETLVGMRIRALAAYDRAMALRGLATAADVSPRRANESTESVWMRFKAVSDALANYLCLAVDPSPVTVSRVAIENADELGDEELLATIGEDERLSLGEASVDRALYLQVLRDYEHSRIPFVVGGPSPMPDRTRNPARGFLRLRREVVIALCNQGLRWGACDFEMNADGSSHNGAMMHFDLADCGGYPEINSLLRFG